MDSNLSIADQRALDAGYYFDPESPEKVKQFFKQFLVHSKGEWAGKPFELLDWQYEDIIKPLFGWKAPDGTRRYRTAYISVGKKNGKSSLLSGIALFGLIADGEPGAEIYTLASSTEQAKIIFQESLNMVNASPLLKKRLEIVESRNRIIFPKMNSIYRVLSTQSQEDSHDGFNAHMVLYDELHRAKTRKLFDVMRYSTAARRQPLFINITTAGSDTESICYEQYRYAKKVLDGSITDHSFFAYIAEADDNDDWTSEETWKKANPSYGITINPKEMAAACQEARNEPRKESEFRRLRLNQWRSGDDQWISTDVWNACASKFTEEDLYGCHAFTGNDLARKHDIAAVVHVIPKGDKFYLIPRFFIPKDNALKKEQTDGVPYSLWAKQGYVTLTEGDVIDYRYIRQAINADAKKFKIQEIGYDPWNAELLCNQQLGQEDGFDVVEVQPTFLKLGPATSYFEKLLKEKRIQHNNNPILNWNASNCVVQEDMNQNIIISKKKSTARVDGIAAAITGLQRAMLREGDSPYNYRGIVQI